MAIFAILKFNRMEKHKFIFISIALLLATTWVSCNKNDDDLTEPAGAVTINLMNEFNGKTVLGNSDVYIEKGSNFYGPNCMLAALGSQKGLTSKTPLLDGLAPRIAVEPGNGFQVFLQSSVRMFPSGKLALNITGDYYNAYVLKNIEQNDSVVGATVKFALMKVPDYGLPAYNTEVGAINHYDFENRDLTIDLPSSDFEVEPVFAGTNYYTLEYKKEGKKLIVSLIDFQNPKVFGFYIRINQTYTYVYGYID